MKKVTVYLNLKRKILFLSLLDIRKLEVLSKKPTKIDIAGGIDGAVVEIKMTHLYFLFKE